MTQRFRPTEAVVDLDAIRHNVAAMKPEGVELLAVVKANAYGHGATEIAAAVLEAGASRLGVALVEEGLELREAGIEAPILILSECPPGAESAAIDADLTPTLYTGAGLSRMAEAAATSAERVRVHVKVDTGMHRVGVYPPADLLAFVQRTIELGLEVEGVFTHLARADDDEPTTKQQLESFGEQIAALEAVGISPPLIHAANSGATIRHPEAHLSMVRAGLTIYGLAPTEELSAQRDLQPALTWRSAVMMVKRLPAGEGISYGHTYRLERDAFVATVPVGYADGYTRRLSGNAEVLIGGARYPVAGTVTMDQLLIDCGDDEPSVGADVVLLGEQGGERISAEELADRSGTINYEIVCGIGERVPRTYVGRR